MKITAAIVFIGVIILLFMALGAFAQDIIVEPIPIHFDGVDMIFLKVSEPVVAATPLRAGKVQIKWRALNLPERNGVIFLRVCEGSGIKGSRLIGGKLWSGSQPLAMPRRVVLDIPVGLFKHQDGRKSKGYTFILNYTKWVSWTNIDEGNGWTRVGSRTEGSSQ